ncbi:chemotaxis protein (plasmid) [Rossellomorea sp. AcN35-11]|nr:chemotaxis protein [Rossellomorea aquimaris]WJV31771.1 chemotaxis protein [Rossellomorea sp. AcN35-11]
MSSNRILLESGTNELEIVEFGLGNNNFGINVIKVKEIINPLEITSVPQSHPSIEGIVKIRGEVMPVINMETVLGVPPSENPERNKLIVCEFNKSKVIFKVHSVSRIHRISWEQIEKPNDMYTGAEALAIGIIHLEDKLVLLLDFEKVIVDINPSSGINVDRLEHLGERERSEKHILIAEDSSFLRQLLKETLEKAGYTNLHFYEDGKQALEYLEKIEAAGKVVEEEIQMVITDIEMPQMDGHHLTRRIKESNQFNKLPVVIFSSLITADLRHKGEKVGANAQVSKPEIAELVGHIDNLAL